MNERNQLQRAIDLRSDGELQQSNQLLMKSS